MSTMKTCRCDRESYRVAHRNHNHSHFESPKGAAHYSEYSGIVCLNCGWRFRSKAKWVFRTPDLTKAELESLHQIDRPPNVGKWGP